MKHVRLWQGGLLLALIGFWYVMTEPGLIPPMMFDNDRQAAFFFGQPLPYGCDAFRRFQRVCKTPHNLSGTEDHACGLQNPGYLRHQWPDRLHHIEQQMQRRCPSPV